MERFTRARMTLVTVGSLALLACALAPVALAAGALDTQNSVTLKSRTLVAPADRAESVRAITEIAPGERRRVLLQLERIPDAQERAALKASGIRLLQYVSNRAWFASVDGGVDAATLNEVRASWLVRPEDRLAPNLARGKVPDHAVDVDGRLMLSLLVFPDVDLNDLGDRVRRLGGTVDSISEPFDTIFVRVPARALSTIAAWDAVHHIEPVAPAPKMEMSRARSYVNQTNLPGAPYNLTGSGIEVSVHEYFHALNHADLSGRWVQGDAAAGQPLDVGLNNLADPNDDNPHASMTAGAIAADGTYDGMATAATVVTYAYESTPCCQANNYADIVLALNRGASVANNSWGYSGCGMTFGDGLPYGDYTAEAIVFDRQVLGRNSTGTAIGDPMVVVFSAGNERYGFYSGNVRRTECITDTSAPYVNYGTINQPKPAKNVIVVGAVDSDNDRMSTFSSWGPTTDGRIRPDIVAAGLHDGSNQSGVSELTDCFGTPTGAANQQCYRSLNNSGSFGGYAWYSQTSAAAAMTSGGAALFIEDYGNLNAGNAPLPSMVKAHLIHTARDLDDGTSWYNPGPDYASGYGLLDMQAAIDQLRSANYAWDCTLDHNTTSTLSLPLPATTEVKLTLVWDDEPASPTTANALVNDLDLVVTDPGGTRHYPWTLNPASPANDAVRTGEDHLNNVEMVLAEGALPAGSWTFEVVGTAVPSGPQCFSIVYSYVESGACVDGDGDGYCVSDDPVADDCDDTNGQIHPGATEFCNEIDDNCNGQVDEGLDCDPLLAILESFTAELTPGGVLLRWSTLFEQDNVGFYVLRSKTGGRSTRRMSELIPARGGELAGAQYEHLDVVEVYGGAVYYYYLEDVDLSGKITRHGPVVVKVGKPLSGTPSRPRLR